ncbi:MAG: glycine oxidase ThiO [Planctomycetes bacterium]|nr:glycine oxidase ThiO [Planctomycetota bacterium]
MSPTPDVIVIGGGVIGLSVAWRLAEQRLRVTLLDRAYCGREASWAGAGILAPCNPHRDDSVYHLHERSLALYPDFCARLGEQTGTDCEYERCGELELLFTQDAWNIACADARAAEGRRTSDGLPRFEMHAPQRVAQLEPAAATGILGAIECRQTAQVRNPRLLRGLHQACLRRGVDVREQTPVRALAMNRDRVVGVVTETDTFAARWVVLCAGAWSSQIDARLDRQIAVHPVRGQIVLLVCERRPFQRIITRGRSYLVPRRDGHVLVGSTEEPGAGFDKRSTARAVASLLERARQLAPDLGQAAVAAVWSGLRPGTPDDRPYIGAVPGFEGLIAATGHYRSGVTLAPATAEAVSALLRGEQYPIDLSCLAPGRA